MKLEFFGIVIFCILCVVFNGTAYGVSENQSCSVQINSISDVSPVIVENNIRSNSDGSVYPGDAIHFLFKFSGSDTCTSFSVKPLVGSENLVFKSALVISDNSLNPKPHDIILYEWVPKYLKTFHYYEIIDSETKCVAKAGGGGPCNTIHTLSENPIVSIREDKQLTTREAKLIKPSSTCWSCKSLHKVVTESWHLVQEKTSYRIGVDEHVLEDKSSVNEFVNGVKKHCSNLSKNSGCVFGHIEIDTKIDSDEQICLFEELDKLGISYDKMVETDQCITINSKNETSISVMGTGISCSDEKCKSYVRTDSASVTPNILHPYGDIFFKYLEIYDSDGFYYFNNDGTYYLDDVLGIQSIPDVQFKKERAGTITFDNSIIGNTIDVISETSCNDSICDVKLSGDKISPSNHIANNGDMISTHYTDNNLGLASIPHESKMYNLNRYIGEYHSTATPLVVCYDPIFSQIKAWSNLADAGHTSFDNRYVMAIKYDGSAGGCADDPDGLYKDRRVEITNFTSVLVNSNYTASNSTLSDVQSIGEMNILESVRNYISNEYAVLDGYAGPTVAINHTVRNVQVNSAGFFQLLFRDYFDNDMAINHANVTVHNELYSNSFGGVDDLFLINGMYTYPLGFFNTSFNVTSYKYVPCHDVTCDDPVAIQDTDVTIGEIIITDNNYDNVSLADFYLNLHGGDSEFGYMHLSGLHEMNVDQYIQSHTGEFLLNQTSIVYDEFSFMTLSEKISPWADVMGGFSNVEEYILNYPSHDFHSGLSSVDMTISADRLGVLQTKSVSLEDVVLLKPMLYYINMSHDNALDFVRANTAVSVPYYPKFGEITNVLVDEKPPKNITCNKGCIVILPDRIPVSIVAENEWGGRMSDGNLTAVDVVQYNPESSDLIHIRLFWMAVVGVMVYATYRGLKMLFARRKGNSM